MMTKRVLPAMALATVLFLSCGREYGISCSDPQIRTAFVNYPGSDIDTFILRKFKAADNYQTLVDSFKVTMGGSGVYSVSGDTTTVYIADGIHGLRAGFDWQLFIPAANKTISISDIISEKKTGTCRSGIFSTDKPGCYCANQVFSAKNNNQPVIFPDAGGNYTIYFRN